jgi:serine protease Do
MGTKEDEGVLVGDVSADGPAHASGIQRGDIILKVNDKTINDSNELRNSISMMKPETSVKLTILRDGSSREMSVKLGELPNQEAKAKSETGSSQSALEGVNVEDINAQTAKQLGLPSSASGVVVTDIDPSSPEAASGLRKGDVIQEVNHHAVKNVSDFEEAVHKAGNNPLLLVNRQGTTIFIAA